MDTCILLVFLLSVLPQDHKSLMPLGEKIQRSEFMKKRSPSPPTRSPLHHHGNATLSIRVIYSSMLLLITVKRLVIVIIPTLGYFFCFVILKQSLFVGGEDNVACLLAAQGQGPGIMEVHYTYKIPPCISVGLLTLSTVIASTVRNSKQSEDFSVDAL